MSAKTKDPTKRVTEARTGLEEIEEAKAAIRERRAEIKGAGTSRASRSGNVAGSPTYGRETDPLAGAGPVWREAVMEGTEEDRRRLRKEWRHLEAEWEALEARETILKRRLKEAEKEAEKAAAPGKLDDLKAELPDLIDWIETSIREAAKALQAGRAWVRETPELMDRAEDHSPAATPEQLHRLGVLLRHRLVEQKEFEVSLSDGRRVKRPALFNSYREGLEAMDLLGEMEQSIWTQLRRRWFGGKSENPDRERKLERQLRVERFKRLADGDLEAVEDAEETAKAVVLSEYPRKRPPAPRGKNAWLSR